MKGSTFQSSSVGVHAYGPIEIAPIRNPLDRDAKTIPEIARRELLMRVKVAGIEHHPHEVSVEEQRLIEDIVDTPIDIPLATILVMGEPEDMLLVNALVKRRLPPERMLEVFDRQVHAA